MSQVSIVAHRGASAYRPGNTLGAFELAIQQGAEFIECDIRLTKDPQVLVWHDWKVMVNGQARAIRDLELYESRAALVKALENIWGAIPLEHIMTLPEFLGWLQQTNTGALIEIKSNPLQDPLLPSLAVRAVRDAGMADRCILVSFDHVVVRHIKAHAPDIRTGILYVARLANLEETINYTKAGLIETHNDYLDLDLVATAHALGCKVCSWSTNDREAVAALVTLGVDMITTDQPDMAKSCADELQAFFREPSLVTTKTSPEEDS